MKNRVAVLILATMAAAGSMAFGDDRYYDRRSQDPRSSGMYGRYADPVTQALRDVQNVWSNVDISDKDLEAAAS